MSDTPQPPASDVKSAAGQVERPTDVILAPPEASRGSASAGTASPTALPPSSSSTPVQIELAARPVTPVPLAWRSWPVVDSLGEFALLTTALVGAPAMVLQSAGPSYAIFTFLVVLAVTWQKFVPTVFELSALGVMESRLGRTRRIPWMSIDRFVIGHRGVFLSSRGAPLEALRGLYLPWGPHREHILATLRYYLPRAEDDAEI